MRIGNFGKVLIRYASSQVASNILRMIAGFVVAKLMAPEQIGLFNGIGIYTGYILLGPFGVINGLNRELPYELGRGNEEHGRELASSVFVFTVYLSIIAGLVFFLVGIYYLLEHNTRYAILYFCYTIIGFLTLLSKQYLPTLYRTNKDFDSLSRQNMLTGVGNVVSVLFVWLFGFWGLCIRGVGIIVYETALLSRNKPYKLKWEIKKEHFGKLFKTGFPIFVAGYIFPLEATVLGTIIFNVGGPVNMGYYQLCIITQGAVGMIPSAFGQIIYPRMAIMYGEGKTLAHIVRVNVKPLFFQLAVLLFIGIAGAVALPIFIPMILPKYANGIYAAQWMMFFPAVQAFGSLLNIFAVVKKMTPYIMSNVIGVVVSLGYVLLQIQWHGFHLVLVPQALILGRTIQQGLSFIFLKRLLNSENKAVPITDNNLIQERPEVLQNEQ